ncbi:hypothetical protein RCCS2_15849 [Roseobacter sp. CCS2]|nr:hypothetical protein RCCS2_15849 [Roseobacter sp. CCS2]
MRSDSATASRTSWVTSRVVQRAARHLSSNQVCIWVRVSASSAPKGSSSSWIDRPWTIVRKRAARWRMPPDSCAGKWVVKSASPKSASNGMTCVRASLRATPCTSNPSVRLSMILRHGMSASRWGMKAKLSS